MSTSLRGVAIPVSLSAMSLSSSQECFNSPYGTQYFADYAEPIPGTSTECQSSVAKECKIYLIGGEEFASERINSFHCNRPPVCSVEG